MSVKIGVCGCAGRMGRMIIEICNNTDDIEVTAAIEHSNFPSLGMDVGELLGVDKTGVLITDDIRKVISNVDVIIDFTLASSITKNIKECVAADCKMVIGTTGLNQNDLDLIKESAKTIPIVFSPNMSIGVNLCLKLLEMTTKVIGDDSDIEIIEAHHRNKKDAPSGTAIGMGEVIAKSLDRDLKECSVYSREGIISERDKNTIGFSSIRAGDIVGEHTVIFASEGEQIEITHKATSRKIFAKGAVKAAKWLSKEEKGLHNMQDVLNII